MSIKIENIVPPSIPQWNKVILSMRNPLNSWSKSDSGCDKSINPEEMIYYKIGPNDLDLMRRLAKAGSDHRKFLRMLPVVMDVTAPLYWWKEADTYKVGTVANSCSTMHKIADNEFSFDDFSHEHLTFYDHDGELCRDFLGTLEDLVDELNVARKLFLETKDKKWWWQMIQLLPSSYNQRRTLFLNYEVLWNMYNARKAHKLDEWVQFCDTIVREMPYFAEIFEIEAAK